MPILRRDEIARIGMRQQAPSCPLAQCCRRPKSPRGLRPTEAAKSSCRRHSVWSGPTSPQSATPDPSSRRLLDHCDAGQLGQPGNRFWNDVRCAAPRDVVDANRQVGRFCQGLEVPIKTLLARLVVVRRDDQRAVQRPIPRVAVCGKPLAPSRNDGRTLEVHRVCTDGTKNACSFLLGACRRAAFEMGYRRIGTYTIPAEGGAAMRAAGWGEPRETRGGRWTNREGRRENKDADGVTKWIWEAYNERPRMMKLKT